MKTARPCLGSISIEIRCRCWHLVLALEEHRWRCQQRPMQQVLVLVALLGLLLERLRRQQVLEQRVLRQEPTQPQELRSFERC